MGSAGMVALTGNLLRAEAAPLSPSPSEVSPAPLVNFPEDPLARRNQANQVRLKAAKIAFDLGVTAHPNNGDEDRYPKHIANYSKGLPHNALGEVSGAAYQIYLQALETGTQQAIEQVPLAGELKLLNPLAGLAFEFIGADSHQFSFPPATRFDSAEQAAEMVENYWMALLRDVPFSQYENNALAQRAITDLNRLSDFKGPKEGGVVTPGTLFRFPVPGVLEGPYISQFLLLDVPYGAQSFTQKNLTPPPNANYITTYDDWLGIQRGKVPPPGPLEPTMRFIRNGRGLAEMVHNDIIFQEYLNAAAIIIGLGEPFDPGHPYINSRTMAPFGTFGHPHYTGMLGMLAIQAARQAWFQKWFVHRRLRPEVFGGRLHNNLTGKTDYPIHPEALNSDAIQAVFSRYGTYLFPTSYSEGSPAHPSYSGGHATVAGACVTLLKAFFDESFVIPNPVVPSDNGNQLLPYSGPPLTVGGELNKLATNVGLGRIHAGVHWRSDTSLERGEAVAIEVLREMRESGAFAETFSGFNLTRFNGTTITV